MDDRQLRGVPASPNECRVRGKIVGVEAGPDGMGWVWKVRVDESHDVDELPNFTKDHVGEVITIYVHPGMRKELKKDDRIEVHVTFQGDKQGGAFFLLGEQVSKL